MKQAVIRSAAIVAALTFAVALFGGTYLYARFTPVAHIVLDTDTAVELTLNRFGTVIVDRIYHKGKANELTMLSLSEKPLPQAVDDIIDAAYHTGSFDTDASLGIFVCVHAADQGHAAILSNTMTNLVNERLRSLGVPCRADSTVCSDALLAAGHNKDVSPALLCMIDALEREYNDPVDAVYKRMLRYTPRQIKAKYEKEMGM